VHRNIRRRNGNYRQELEERVAELTDQLSYWQQIRAEQIAAGQATNHDPIAKGDAVKIRNRGNCGVQHLFPLLRQGFSQPPQPVSLARRWCTMRKPHAANSFGTSVISVSSPWDGNAAAQH